MDKKLRDFLEDLKEVEKAIDETESANPLPLIDYEKEYKPRSYMLYKWILAYMER